MIKVTSVRRNVNYQMATNNFKTISIRRTGTEWKILEKKVKDSGKDDLGHLLRSKIAEFISEYNECPDCKTKAKGKRTERRPSIHCGQIIKLIKIGNEMDLKVSTLVDRLIIEPLLRP